MSIIKVPYGKSIQKCSILPNAKCISGSLGQIESQKDEVKQINEALLNLIGSINFEKLKHANSVAIAVSDITRPVPSRLLLNALVDWLASLGIPEERVIVLIGGGLHRPATVDDLQYIMGKELLTRIKRVVAHDADCIEMLTFLGTSSGGTPIYINNDFVNAEYKIVTGMVDAHQFMGFTAGVKGAVIGLGGRPTITANHARLFIPGAELGRIEDNPARLDLEEIGKIIGVDLIVNVVLNSKKKVVKAVAGHPILAHREAVKFAKTVFGVRLSKADIVIASPGGFPKDINIYQAQKALTPASQIVREGGTIILVAQCPEGTGEESFRKVMAFHKSPKEVLDSLSEKEFIIGPHKAYLWARTLTKARTILVSDCVSPELAKELMVELRPTLQDAIDYVLADYSGEPIIAVLPNANSTIPILTSQHTKLLI